LFLDSREIHKLVDWYDFPKIPIFLQN
jgi:hypothetical protein